MGKSIRIPNRNAVVECLTRDRGAAGLSLTGVTALCPRARHINPSLVLVQPRKTRPFITEILFMGPKESKKKKNTKWISHYFDSAVTCSKAFSFKDLDPDKEIL